MSTDAQRELAEAERACENIPLWLPRPIFRRRLDAAMARWGKAFAVVAEAEREAITRLWDAALAGDPSARDEVEKRYAEIVKKR